MAEKQRTGLVSYGGDSEISDNEIEDENMLINTTPPRSSFAPQVMLNSFGIPSSKPRTPSSPPDFVRPIVRSAPRGGLVANYGDLDDSVVHHDEVFQSEESGIQGNNTCHSITSISFRGPESVPLNSPNVDYFYCFNRRPILYAFLQKKFSF